MVQRRRGQHMTQWSWKIANRMKCFWFRVREARTVQKKSSSEFLLACLAMNFNCKVLTQGNEVGMKSFNEKNAKRISITSDFCCFLTCIWRRNYFPWNHSSLQTPVLYHSTAECLNPELLCILVVLWINGR